MQRHSPTEVITTTTTTTTNQSEPETIRLKKKNKKKVGWRSDTIDNENAGKKSSKCCCVYHKPHKFGDSSSDSEQDDCNNCRGHKEKRTVDKTS